jgi:hypothetical protein
LYCKIFTLLSVFSVIIFTSCKKFDKEEKIPSYIRIKNSILSCDSISQGSNRHNLCDVWVNIDGNRQGTYELPVVFPVLNTGNHVVQLRAGIKSNGIAANRMPYPFLNLYSIDTLLTPNNILELTPIYKYNSLTVFNWKENFENNGFTLARMSKSDTVLTVGTDPLNNQQHYGEYHIDSNHPVFQYKSNEAYEALLSSNVFLEFDYKCNYPIVVGMILNKVNSSIETDILVVNPHPNSFNHIYVNLGTTLLANIDAIDFNIFFGASLENGYDHGYAYIDNIKLLHF